MSGHRRVKDIAFDEADYEVFDDEDQEDSISPEDKEKLRKGRLAVRTRLGTLTDVSDATIEDALWYYYFDEARSIAYLQDKFKQVRKQPPNAKQSGVAPVKDTQHYNHTCPQEARVSLLRIFPKNFALIKAHDAGLHYQYDNRRERKHSLPLFEHIPWLSVPVHRRGHLWLLENKGLIGLRGGGPQVPQTKSKLASLSASRRKIPRPTDIEDQHVQAEIYDQGKIKGSNVTFLDQLSNQGSLEAESKDFTPDESPNRIAESPEGFLPKIAGSRPQPTLSKKRIEGFNTLKGHGTGISSSASPEIAVGGHRGSPTLFAQAILGYDMDPSLPRATQDQMLTLEYRCCPSSANCDLFSASSSGESTFRQQRKSSPDLGRDARKDVERESTNVSTSSNTSKLVDVAQEHLRTNRKENVSFVVIGHVDHGKSTLMGRLLYDLDAINRRSVDKLHTAANNIGKGSFGFAWILDSTEEERSRGVTIDVAMNQFETPNAQYTILDAPGHQDFVPNMISGVSQADFALLVVDANSNAFESGLRGQTKEHALLARSMGVSSIIVAVNKMDQVNWSKQRYTEIEQQLSAFFSSAGFPEARSVFVPCSGLTGGNVVSRSHDIESDLAWYQGPTLVEALDALRPVQHNIEGPLRMTVNDVFKTGPQNILTISGRIDAGSLQIGLQALFMPSTEIATISGLAVGGVSVPWVVAGQIAAVSLEGIDPANVRVGDVVCNPVTHPIKNVTEVSAKVLAFCHLMPMELNIYKGALTTSATISGLVQIFEKRQGKPSGRKPRVVKPGQVAVVNIGLGKPLPLERSSRIVLRSDGQTVAAGVVEAAS